MFVWSEGTLIMRAMWKCASMDIGDISVLMDGISQGLWSCVSSCLETAFVSVTSLLLINVVPVDNWWKWAIFSIPFVHRLDGGLAVKLQDCRPGSKPTCRILLLCTHHYPQISLKGNFHILQGALSCNIPRISMGTIPLTVYFHCRFW